MEQTKYLSMIQFEKLQTRLYDLQQNLGQLLVFKVDSTQINTEIELLHVEKDEAIQLRKDTEQALSKMTKQKDKISRDLKYLADAHVKKEEKIQTL